jgi:lactoylglutathione lyase
VIVSAKSFGFVTETRISAVLPGERAVTAKEMSDPIRDSGWAPSFAKLAPTAPLARAAQQAASIVRIEVVIARRVFVESMVRSSAGCAQVLSPKRRSDEPAGTEVWRDEPRRGFFSYDRAMTRYLHTMVRITDPEKSRAFYEALGLEFRRESPIVRNGELEATLYFFGVPGQEEELELTFNHDGRSYEVGTGYGHIALGVDDLDETLAQLEKQGIEPEREPYRVRDGGSRICFVQDPDGYRIELIDRSGA